MNWSDLGTLAPIVLAVLTAAAVLVVDMAAPGRRAPAIATALVGLTVVGLVVLSLAGHTETAFGGAYVVDALTAFLDLLFVAIAALTILFAADSLEPPS
jgi:NADH:ubiquinone oxidoreductase subunit 2 (subunit N)